MHSVRFIILFFLIVGLSGVFFGVQAYYKGFSYDPTLIRPIIDPFPPPTPQLAMPVVKKSTVTSPDGIMESAMQTTQKETSVDYLLTSRALSSEKSKTIFRTQGEKDEFSLPQNSWSPDNKYLFITQVQGASVSALVFKASGESFTNGDQYIDVLPLFTKRDSGYAISDITGWDSETLLHILTKKGSEIGPSFWFEVPSNAFYQLAR